MSVIVERALLEHVRVETYNTFTNPFTLNRSRLGYAALGDDTSVGVWTNWVGQVISVSSRRGGIRDGITVRNSPGLLAVQIRDLVIDPFQPAMLPDQPFRLVLDLAGATHTLFTGKLRDMRTDYRRLQHGRPPAPITTIVAVDAVADHDAVTRYGAIPTTGEETFPDRIRRLAQTATAPLEIPDFLDMRGNPPDPVMLGRTVYESSVSNHLTLACNTVRAMWWVDPDGVTRFQPRVWDEASVIEFTAQEFSVYPNPLHHIDHTLENGTQSLFNIEVAHNLGAVDDGAGGWTATETTLELNTPAPSTVPMGRRRVIFETNAADPIDMLSNPMPGTWLLGYRDMSDKPGALRWNAQEDLSRIPDLEIGRSVFFNLPGVATSAYPRHIIIGVAHTITPTRWLTDLTLIGA